MKIENVEKKNVLCLNYYDQFNNLYLSIDNDEKNNFIFKSNLDNLSLESYDAYIVDMYVFAYNNINIAEILNNIYKSNKPVVLIYSSEMYKDFEGIKYLEDNFEIEFENKDAEIIENNYDGYMPHRDRGYAMSMISKRGKGKAYVKNTKNCFILKFGNVTIMHDIENVYNGQGFAKNNNKLLTILLDNLGDVEKPDWIQNIRILDEAKLEKNIEEIDKEINNLQCEKTRLLKDLDSIVEYKKLLYATGDELVQIVKKVLIEMLNVLVKDADEKKEDLSFELEDKKCLVEVKGANTSVKREYVSQVQNHIFDDAKKEHIEDEQISTKYKGLLIVNPYIKGPIQERKMKEFYSKTVISDLKHFDICAIDTITLLGLFNKFKMEGNVDLKDIILNSNYIKPDFSILNLK